MRRLVKAAAVAAGVLVGLAAVTVGAVYAMSESRMRKSYDVPAATLEVRRDSATLARGAHIVAIRACRDCHGQDLGGALFLDEPPIGIVYGANLTAGAGGIGGTYGPEDFERAIRHGVAKDGRALLVMPSQEFAALSDEDVAAVIAYLQSLPPVDRVQPRSTVGPLGRALFLLGKVPLLPAELVPHEVRTRTAPPAGPTAEYGRYLATSCTGCHGDGFSGGPIPGMPPDFPAARNLTPDAATGIGTWSEADFFRALREGRRPDGTAIREAMPWRAVRLMTDDEIRALYAFLRTVPAKGAGQR